LTDKMVWAYTYSPGPSWGTQTKHTHTRILLTQQLCIIIITSYKDQAAISEWAKFYVPLNT